MTSVNFVAFPVETELPILKKVVVIIILHQNTKKFGQTPSDLKLESVKFQHIFVTEIKISSD